MEAKSFSPAEQSYIDEILEKAKERWKGWEINDVHPYDPDQALVILRRIPKAPNQPTQDMLLHLNLKQEETVVYKRIERWGSSKRQARMSVVGAFAPEDVLPYTTPESPETRGFLVGDVTYLVNMHSLRYDCFRHSLACVACGLVGTEMVLECHPNSIKPHFNLYGVVEGRRVLMTKDHIVPKSRGGRDHESNLQTMCVCCNGKKGNHCEVPMSGPQEKAAEK